MDNLSNLAPLWSKRIINVFCLIIFMTGLFALSATLVNIFLLKKITVYLFNLEPVVAFNFVLSALVLYLASQEEMSSRLLRLLSVVLTFIIALVAIIIFLDDIIVSLLLENVNYTIREPFTVAINFILIAIGIFISISIKKPKLSLVIIGSLVFGIALFSISQYVYRVNFHYSLTTITRISPVPSMLFILCSIVLPLTRPNEYFTKILIGDSAAGKYARRILFYIIVIPLFISYVENLGEVYQLYDADFGDSIVLALSTMVVIFIVFISTKAFYEEEQLKLKSEKSLEYITYYDAVTDTLNRHGFQEHLKDLLINPGNKLIAIFKLNSNQIDMINHIAGFEATNLLLRELADRYKRLNLINDIIIGRIGQYQFGFIIKNIDNIENISIVADKILGITSAPFIVNGKETILTSSIGISVYPDDGKTAESLLDAAYVALLEAQKQTGNYFQFCTPYLTFSLSERLKTEIALQEAISKNQFTLYYQPQLNLKTDKLSGAEALLRWLDPKKGLLMPSSFIQIAEDTNLIIPIGDWIMREACRQVKEGWPFFDNTSNVDAVTLAVNISSKQFNQTCSIATMFKQLIREFDISPRLLELEITESLLMADTESNLKCLSDLKKIGFQIAIDDFESGFSSFNYLSQLPNDKIKIDKSFIDRVPHNESDITIVKAIIAMAHALGKKVIAEGVENAAQMKLLKEINCDYVQGNYYSPALSLAEFKVFVNASHD